MAKETITLRLPPELIARLDTLSAGSRGVRQEIIETATREFVDYIEANNGNIPKSFDIFPDEAELRRVRQLSMLTEAAYAKRPTPANDNSGKKTG